MINWILILDTETSSLDDSAVCIEVAAALFSVPHASVVRSVSSLIRAEANPARDVNRIPDALLALAPPASAVWPVVQRFAEHADAIVAHKAEFDRRFVPAAATAGRPWICTMDDVQFPRGASGDSLVKLALAHDLGVATAHRAAADVDLLARLLTRVREMGHELGPLLERGLRPKAKFVVAERGYDPKRNELAKAAGFKFVPTTKDWIRSMAIEDAAKLPFETRRVD